MKKITIFISLVLLLNYSCKNVRNDDEIRSMNAPSRSLKVLEELVEQKGDTNAYYELEIAYLDNKHGEFFKYAKVMADKYDYPQAYFDVYFQILRPTQDTGTTISLDSCSKEERSLAIYYLQKAKEKGHEQAKDEIEELTKKGFIK